MSVAGAALRDDRTVGDIESGEQRRRSMPIVVVGHPFDVADPQRQDRLATFQVAWICVFSSTQRTRA